MTAPIDSPIAPSPDAGISTRLFPKGFLKIFLGASPGVGKTFAMLQAASERKQEGVDVVAGLVETHKRKETEDQLKNLEIIPRKKVMHRGRAFEELDVDGVLTRAPQLVLIDECAHSNLPGSRHPKRYNDIAEILGYGIDVYTTLNIQHLESLKDIVEQMTHVIIRESVPDSFIQSADEVQLIDLPPDDLLQRLADGKVYVPEQAQAAIEHFFTRSNLLTLRELALRHTVAVADDKMTRYVQQRGIKGPWPASDKVMVCVGTDLSTSNLVRTARRMADRMQAKWIAVTVETPDDEVRTVAVQQQLSRTLRLAQELGAEEVTALDGNDVAETLIQHALANNVTEMLIGQSAALKAWQKIPLVGPLLGGKSIAERVLFHHLPFAVRVMPMEEREGPSVPQTSPHSFFRLVLPYAYSLMITLGMLFAAGEISKYASIGDISILFFLSVLWVSVKFERAPALVATIIGGLVYNYAYIEPKRQWSMDTLEGWVIFLSFIFAAFIVSNVAIHSRNVFSASQGKFRQIRFFSTFVQRLIGCRHKNEVLSLLCEELHRFLAVSVIAFGEIHDMPRPTIQYPEMKNFRLTEADVSAIQWALAHQIRSGKSTENFSDAHYLYLPLKIGNNSLGIVGIWALKNQLTIDDFRVAQTVIDQAALAIDRLSHIQNTA